MKTRVIIVAVLMMTTLGSVCVAQVPKGMFGDKKETSGLHVAKNYKGGLKKGADITAEIAVLLGTCGTPAEDLAEHPEIQLYQGVNYLANIKDAAEALGIKRISSGTGVSTPGFPKMSFRYSRHSGTYEGGFNKLVIMVDKSKQVVALQFVDESPATTRLSGHLSTKSMYNLIENRKKGKKTYVVSQVATAVGTGAVKVQCEVLDEKRKPREYSELYIAKPVLDLILLSCQ